ncbi:MAG: hypothetical protein ACUVTW_00065 [Thermogutta sp.]
MTAKQKERSYRAWVGHCPAALRPREGMSGSSPGPARLQASRFSLQLKVYVATGC